MLGQSQSLHKATPRNPTNSRVTWTTAPGALASLLSSATFQSTAGAQGAFAKVINVLKGRPGR